MKNTILALLILVFSFRLYGSCDQSYNQDNRSPTFVGENNHQLMRNQNKSDWCYAFAATDLVTDYIRKNNPALLRTSNGESIPRENQLISPMGLISGVNSLSGGDGDGRSFVEATAGGQVTQVVVDIFTDPNSKICLENDVNSSNILSEQEVDTFQFSVMLDRLENLYNSADGNVGVVASGICQNWNGGLNRTLPGLGFRDFQRVVMGSFNKGLTSRQMSANILEYSCSNPLNIGPLPPIKRVRKISHEENDNSSEYLNAIEEQLNNNGILAIEYNGFYLESIDGKENGESIYAPHISTIVGKRCTGSGTKEFLIRNSYGTDCEFYDESLDCDEGNIWVPENILLEMSTRVNYL